MGTEIETIALALPNRDETISSLKAINEFGKIVHQLLIEGSDWGVIPGTQKPTLLKPGAEKITKILGLADTYEVTQRVEEWEKGFFHYEVKCTLTHLKTGIVISEGLGSCNSMESKYRYRWLWSSELPPDFDGEKAVKRWVTLKSGSKSPQYRVDNEDIYSQVNTLLKMAEKRSLVDAALHAGRLSDLFTQDIEDINIGSMEQEGKETEVKDTETHKEHWCEEHNCAFVKKHKFGKDYWSHPLPGGKWCNEKKKETESKAAPAAESTEELPSDEPNPPPEAKVEELQHPKSERDPDTLKTINDLYRACNEDWKLQPAEVIKELGVSSQSDIAETPADCYRKIEAVR